MAFLLENIGAPKYWSAKNNAKILAHAKNNANILAYDHVSVGGYDERTNSEKNIVHSRISSVGFFAF